MNFDDFDKQMRAYEQSLDQVITPDTYIVVRLDGRSFTKLTKETCKFEAPFDERFRDMMANVTKYLMENSGFKVVYGYTQSDEISLLLQKDDNTFGRKVRKINTTLAGEASAAFTILLAGLPGVPNVIGTFDCRVVPLPNMEKVCDYFCWRQEDAYRNSLNSWCYWTLRKEGWSVHKATNELKGKGIAYKNELLFQREINYNDLPSWQKRGIGFFFSEEEREGFNPKTGEKVMTKRRVLMTDYELPIAQEYREYVSDREKGIPIEGIKDLPLEIERE